MSANRKAVTPFDNIESAHEYVQMLVEAVDEATREIQEEIAQAGTGVPRRVDAMRLAGYKLDKLKAQLVSSGRILNDLRTLRRLLLEERSMTGDS